MTVEFSPLHQCIGKIRYRKREWAKHAILEMRARGRDMTGMGAYLCPHCGMFHIGHRPPSQAFDARPSEAS